MPRPRDGWLPAFATLSVFLVVALPMLVWGVDWIVRPVESPRLLLSGLVTAGLIALSVRGPAAAMLLTLWWLPLMGMVRRLFDTLGALEFDPLLAIAPGVAAGMTLLAFNRFRASISHSLKSSVPTRLATCLTALFAFHAVVGVAPGFAMEVSSAFFLLGPILWFFLGRAYLDESVLRKLLLGSMVIAVACALLGFYQTFVGFLPYEEDWIDRKLDTFSSLHIGRFIRPFSTFSNPEEWSRYTAIAGTAAVAMLMGGKARRGWLGLVLAFAVGTLVISGIRTSIFGFVTSMVVVIWLMARTRTIALVWLGVLAGALGMFFWLSPALTWGEVEASNVAWMAIMGHTTRGLRSPLEEDSFLVRLDIWKDVFTGTILPNPLGFGSIVGASESYLVTVFIQTGIPGGLLFMGLVVAMALHARRVCRGRRDAILAAVVASLAGITLTSLSGNSLALYSVGPLGWAFAGWLSAQTEGKRRAR